MEISFQNIYTRYIVVILCQEDYLRTKTFKRQVKHIFRTDISSYKVYISSEFEYLKCFSVCLFKNENALYSPNTSLMCERKKKTTGVRDAKSL